jgi:DNA mismatch repair ATPase MutS
LTILGDKHVNYFTPPAPDYFQEYRKLKQQYPDALLLIRMGNFYETFCEDAETLAKICRTRLWHLRDGASAGLPEVYIETHHQRLVTFGCQVVFAEEVDGRFQVTGPPDAAKVVPVRSRKSTGRRRGKGIRARRGRI